jgi:hypothetical protein
MNELRVARYFNIALLLLGTTLVVLGWQGCSCAMDKENNRPEPPVSGGSCEYKVYEGTATIISVRKKEMPKGYPGPSHDSYEVRFSFQPDEKIEESYAQVEGKEYILLLTNSWYPGPKFLEKYGIRKGETFACHLKVITKGTCTPVLFEFPAIDLSDYFESRT